jgi:ribonuclease D
VKRATDRPRPAAVTTDTQLRSACDRLASEGCFAFDTEFIMEDGYETTVCLIQAASESQVLLIDPLAGVDTRPFWELVADPAIQVVLHAGMEDLALCRQLIGKTPANVFDVQVAAGLVGRDYPLSLTRLVHKYVGVRLRKTQTLTDWRRRPLTEAQQAYAVDDVAYIPAVHRTLIEKLKQQGRLDWAVEEFARFEVPQTYEPPKEIRLIRLKGIGSLDPEGLAVASELIEIREKLARNFDRPARAVLRDHLLVEIARHRWTRADQIKSLRGLNLRARAVEELARAVKRGLAVPREQCPTMPESAEDTPKELVLISLLTAVLRDFCLARNIAFALMTTKQAIRQLVHSYTRGHPDASPLSRGWRAEAAGEMLLDVLQGQAAITVTGSHCRPKLKIQAVATGDPATERPPGRSN